MSKRINKIPPGEPVGSEQIDSQVHKLVSHRISQVRTEVELHALKDAWRALLADTPDAPIFLTWEWVSTWWRHYGQDRELWVLTAHDGAGRLVGIAPWMLERNRIGPLYVRRIKFIGSGEVCPDHLDCIARSDDKEAICVSFLSYLHSHAWEWEILDLEGLAQGSALKSFLVSAGRRYQEKTPIICPFVVLPQDWDSFIMNSLGIDRRRQLRRSRSHLEKEYPNQVVFRRIMKADELSSAMNRLIELGQQRWENKTQPTAFSHKRFAAFHHEMAALAHKQGWLRFYQLQVADQVIATNYGFYYQNVFYDYQHGFDSRWDTFSPGRQLLAHALQEAIQEGAKEFDMLRGTEPYKSLWTCQSHADSHVTLASPSVKGYLWLILTSLRDTAKLIAKKVLPQSIKLQLGQLLDRRGDSAARA